MIYLCAWDQRNTRKEENIAQKLQQTLENLSGMFELAQILYTKILRNQDLHVLNTYYALRLFKLTQVTSYKFYLYGNSHMDSELRLHF